MRSQASRLKTMLRRRYAAIAFTAESRSASCAEEARTLSSRITIIYANAFSGVEIKEGANPTLRRNKIHDQKQNGVHVHDEGKGLFEDNDIRSNQYSGVRVQAGGDPLFRGNRISKNGTWGIVAKESGKGTFEKNDLRGITKGAWFIDESSETLVKRSENIE
jgi:parallel beta-helix repeat protein